MKYFLAGKTQLNLVLLIAFILMMKISSVTGQITPAAIQQDDQNGMVTLSFIDSEIANVVAAFSESLGKPFLLDPRVKGKISLQAPNPIPLIRAYEMFVASLDLYGFDVVEGEFFNTVVPATDAKTKAPELIAGSKIERNGLITKVFKLKNQSAAEIMNAVRALVPATNPITVNSSSNTLIVTDISSNIEKIGKLISAVDDTQIWYGETFRAQHIPINDLAFLVDRAVNESNKILKNQMGDFSRLTIIPSSRTNSMYLKSYKKKNIELAISVASKFDMPTANPGNVHVVYLKNAEAAYIADTLQNLFGLSEIKGASTENLSSGSKQSIIRRQDKLQEANKLSSSPESGISIQAEPNVNAVLVVAAEPIFRQIKKVIDLLDIRRAQVFLESLIVEISADKAAEFGVQFQYLGGLDSVGEQFFGGTNFSSGGDNLLSLIQNPTLADGGLNIGVINGTVNVPGVGDITNLGLLIRALETQGNANVIATPTLLTLDNEEAKIVIGQNVPFVTGQFTSTATGNNPFQTVERRDVGTTLTVKPLITQGNTVKLKIFQEVSRVLDSELSSTFGTVSTTKRSIDSTVLVEDEQFVVLGGLIQDQDADIENKVPLLGDLPIMGNFFKYESKSRRKTNLFVFLRPVVIRNQEDANVLTADRYTILRGIAEREQRKESFILPNFDPLEIPKIPTYTD
tara:strand:+ start:71878 stop:73935 length:2058 start_codon:yes stop_codon:yes gene_type:complete